jgi:hypothetical protein
MVTATGLKCPNPPSDDLKFPEKCGKTKGKYNWEFLVNLLFPIALKGSSETQVLGSSSVSLHLLYEVLV